jgi:hypothetical protein
MTITVGANTPYSLTLPALSEAGDIQVALKLLAYGQSSDPSNDADIEGASLVGYLKTGLALKSNIASPTFTGTVTLPAGTSSVVPLKFASSNTLKSSPQAGALEYNGSRLYITRSDSARKTVAHTDELGHILLFSGTIAYVPAPNSGILVSGRDFSEYRKIRIIFKAGANGGSGTFSIRFNSVSDNYEYTYNNYGNTTLQSTTGGTGYNISQGSGSIGTGKSIYVDVNDPGDNLIPKHVSWQNSNGFGFGTNNSISAAIATITWHSATTTPGATWEIYGIK